MLQIGKFNQLSVQATYPFGFHLGDGEINNVLLPLDQAPEGCAEGHSLRVFVYQDKEGNLLAATQPPLIELGQVASLTVKTVTGAGAFLDWGLTDDLFLPRGQQASEPVEGMPCVVYLYIDAVNDKLTATAKLHQHLQENGSELAPRQAVDLLVFDRTDMGYKAVVDNTYLGLIFKDEVLQPLEIGQRLPGFVKRVREDNKIDLCFQFHDSKARRALTEQILDDLEAHGGLSTLTDKSSPEEIQRRFGVSKGAYKKALGQLYKQKQILLQKDKITLIK